MRPSKTKTQPNSRAAVLSEWNSRWSQRGSNCLGSLFSSHVYSRGGLFPRMAPLRLCLSLSDVPKCWFLQYPATKPNLQFAQWPPLTFFWGMGPCISKNLGASLHSTLVLASSFPAELMSLVWRVLPPSLGGRELSRPAWVLVAGLDKTLLSAGESTFGAHSVLAHTLLPNGFVFSQVGTLGRRGPLQHMYQSSP